MQNDVGHLTLDYQPISMRYITVITVFLCCRNKFGPMTFHVLRAFDVKFSLQVIHQPIVDRMRVFSCASDVGKSVTRQTAAVFRF